MRTFERICITIRGEPGTEGDGTLSLSAVYEYSKMSIGSETGMLGSPPCHSMVRSYSPATLCTWSQDLHIGMTDAQTVSALSSGAEAQRKS